VLRTRFLVIAALLHATVAVAQTTGCPQRVLPLSITTSDGSPIRGTQISFEAKYRGKAVHIDGVQPTSGTRPLRVLLLIDVSGSMIDQLRPDWDLMIDVADDVLARLPASTEVGMALFSTDIAKAIPPTASREELTTEAATLRKPEAVRLLGPTALRHSIIRAAELLDSPQLGDVVYVMTDAGDNASKETSADVVQFLASRGVRLFAFTLEERGDLLQPQEGTEEVSKIVRSTGGSQIDALESLPGLITSRSSLNRSGKPNALAAALDRQYQQIGNVVRLSIELPEAVDKPRGWELRAKAADKTVQTKLEITYPEQLVPCQ
jgi:hypothetical protein